MSLPPHAQFSQRGNEKMGISNDERMQVLELLQSMAYVKNEDVYNRLYEQLMSTRFTAVKN